MVHGERSDIVQSLAVVVILNLNIILPGSRKSLWFLFMEYKVHTVLNTYSKPKASVS